MHPSAPTDPLDRRRLLRRDAPRLILLFQSLLEHLLQQSFPPSPAPQPPQVPRCTAFDGCIPPPLPNPIRMPLAHPKCAPMLPCPAAPAGAPLSCFAPFTPACLFHHVSCCQQDPCKPTFGCSQVWMLPLKLTRRRSAGRGFGSRKRRCKWSFCIVSHPVGDASQVTKLAACTPAS